MGNKRKQETWVAVVMTGDGESQRADGALSSFVGGNRDKVIEKALSMTAKWSATRPYREYYVAVGQLTQRAVVPVQFELIPL